MFYLLSMLCVPMLCVWNLFTFTLLFNFFSLPLACFFSLRSSGCSSSSSSSSSSFSFSFFYSSLLSLFHFSGYKYTWHKGLRVILIVSSSFYSKENNSGNNKNSNLRGEKKRARKRAEGRKKRAKTEKQDERRESQESCKSVSFVTWRYNLTKPCYTFSAESEWV